MAGIRSMGERYQRPDWVRRLNAMGESVGGGPEGARRLIPIDGEALLAEAERDLGPLPRSDFGDPAWRERFRALAHALDGAPLHVVGRLLTKQELLRSLRTRLLLTRARAEHPGMADEAIEAPLVITGPPRSGTSILFELLAGRLPTPRRCRSPRCR